MKSTEMISNKIYSSRSKIEVFLDCPRMGYIQFLWAGRGLVKRGASVYLSTGTYTHIGLESIFVWCKNHSLTSPPQDIIDVSCDLATNAYRQEIQERGFDLEQGEDRKNEKYVVEEQCALVEAFIRAFCYVVLPDLLAQYRIVDVEREEIYEEGNLILQGKIDVVMEEIATAHIYIISFKTAANWDRRQEKANEHDNQGLSETFLLEKRLAKNNEFLYYASDEILKGFPRDTPLPVVKATTKYLEYISKFRSNDKVMGVLMFYFLKGKRYETSEGSGKWEQHSPLIRAYRKLVGVEYEYAGSLFFPKAENKSGWGRLGKGWDDFAVWEEEGGVKEWIRKLASDEVTGGRELLAKQFKIPTAYFRKQEHLDSWYRQTRAIENEIHKKHRDVIDYNYTDLSFREKLDYYFPQRRRNCHYPTDCQYVDICYTDTIFDDPIGSGKFIWRRPHHVAEEEAHKILYQISNTQEQQGGGKLREKVDEDDVVLSADEVSKIIEEEGEVIIDE